MTNILFFTSQRANLTGLSCAYTDARAQVLSYTRPVDSSGYTFLVKRTPATQALTKTSELAVVKGMSFGIKKGGVKENYFKHTTDAAEKWIYKIVVVSVTMLCCENIIILLHAGYIYECFFTQKREIQRELRSEGDRHSIIAGLTK